MKDKIEIKKPEGKLGVLLPGLGAVATTFIAGTMLVRRGLGQPFGSLTQMGTIRLGKRTEKRVPRIKDFVELAELGDLVFGAWDIFPDNAYEAALKAGVLRKEHLDPIKEELEKIKPSPAVFDRNYVKKLDGPNKKKGATKYDLALQLMDDIKRFKEEN
ncbi:MAG TPA: inositol-3-phosphate synthase, partial [Candidatus Saccharicenans sp.]|nr:inositol-3-phosphate synthase [Candidatus Saccharicenans sp.]